MKKHLLFAATLVGVIAIAQTGKVGVNTENPTETFQVEGTARITELPTNTTEDAIFTNDQGERSTSKNQTFNATRTVVVDKNGVLGTVDGIPRVKGKQRGQLQPYAPIQKCTKGTSGDNSSKELMFGNYTFQIQKKDSDMDVYMKTSSGSSEKVRVTQLGGQGGVPGSGLNDGADKDISSGWTKIVDAINSNNSDAQNGTVIVSKSATTFNYFVRTISGSPAYYSFCVEQMVFDK